MPERSLAPRPPWAGRRILLGVTGGVAAFKAVQLASDLTRLGARVDTVLTEAARSFVAPLSFEGVTGQRVYGQLLSTFESPLHLHLAGRADAVVVAPATADLIARARAGRADDLLAAILLATRAPVLLAPAMNERMYTHPQTRRNLAHCRSALGYRVVGPVIGALAAGEGEGPGRMSEPFEIAEHLGRLLGAEGTLSGRRVLVTAGPTREPLDPVRFVGSRSSGRMGFALARESWLRGADVTLVTGPSALAAPVGVSTRRVETAREMLTAVESVIPRADLAFFSAAVADFRPRTRASEKIRRRESAAPPVLDLERNPDVALETLPLRKEGAVAVGFALETGRLHENAAMKLREKRFDIVVANDPGEPGAGFDLPTNRVTLFYGDRDPEPLPLQLKEALAVELVDRAIDAAPWNRPP